MQETKIAAGMCNNSLTKWPVSAMSDDQCKTQCIWNILNSVQPSCRGYSFSGVSCWLFAGQLWAGADSSDGYTCTQLVVKPEAAQQVLNMQDLAGAVEVKELMALRLGVAPRSDGCFGASVADMEVYTLYKGIVPATVTVREEDYAALLVTIPEASQPPVVRPEAKLSADFVAVAQDLTCMPKKVEPQCPVVFGSTVFEETHVAIAIGAILGTVLAALICCILFKPKPSVGAPRLKAHVEEVDDDEFQRLEQNNPGGQHLVSSALIQVPQAI